MIFSIVIFLLIIEIIICKINIHYAIGYIITIIYLIPSIIKFSFGIVNLNVFNLSVILFLFATCYFIKNKKIEFRNHYKTIIYILLYIYVVSFFASLDIFKISDYFKYTLLNFLEFFAFPLCLLFLRFDSKQIDYFNKMIYIVCFIISIYAIINYITKINPYITYLSLVADYANMQETFLTEQRGVLEGRVSSTFIHPLILGQSMLLCISYLFFQKKSFHKILYYLIIILLYITIFLSGSRSTLIPALLIPCIYILYSSIKKIFKYTFFLILFTPIIFAVIPKDYRETIEGLVYVWDSSKAEKVGIKGSNTDMRETQILDAIKIVENDFFFGKGNGYIKAHGSEHPEMLGYEGLLLFTIIEYGLLGTIFFLLFYFSFFKLTLKHAKKKIDKAQVISLNITYLMCIILTGISYSTFSTFLIFNIIILNQCKNKKYTQNMNAIANK